jgi:hypothetical protein
MVKYCHAHPKIICPIYLNIKMTKLSKKEIPFYLFSIKNERNR